MRGGYLGGGQAVWRGALSGGGWEDLDGGDLGGGTTAMGAAVMAVDPGTGRTAPIGRCSHIWA